MRIFIVFITWKRLAYLLRSFSNVIIGNRLKWRTRRQMNPVFCFVGLRISLKFANLCQKLFKTKFEAISLDRGQQLWSIIYFFSTHRLAENWVISENITQAIYPFQSSRPLQNSIQDERALFCGCYRWREAFVFP